MSIRIVTDSTCDLPPEVIAEHAITVVPLYINIGSDSYLDGLEMSREQFYEGLPHFSSHPTTSVPGQGTFREVYRQLAAEGASAIISIHISVNLSAVANSARLGAQQSGSIPITVFDSGQLTLGTGLIVAAAARAAEQGDSVADIVSQLQDLTGRTHSIAALDTVEFLRRSGRLSRFQSSLATVLSIKPLLKMHRGEMSMERVRTRRRAVERLVELVTELGQLEELALVHTNAPERAAALGSIAADLFPNARRPLMAAVTPVIGAHVGPGAVGFVAVQAQRRSE